MKLFTLALALFSLKAVACPQLGGDYTCTSGKDSGEVSVLQATEEDTTYYKVGDKVIAADDKEVVLPDSDSLKSGTVKGSCPDDNSVSQQIVGKFYSEKVYFGDITLTTTYTKNDKGFQQKVSRVITNHGGRFPLDVTVDCVKK